MTYGKSGLRKTGELSVNHDNFAEYVRRCTDWLEMPMPPLPWVMLVERCLWLSRKGSASEQVSHLTLCICVPCL